VPEPVHGLSPGKLPPHIHKKVKKLQMLKRVQNGAAVLAAPINSHKTMIITVDVYSFGTFYMIIGAEHRKE
jgi:hypothetical protein